MTYTPPSISGYDSTYAPDDGSQVAGNQITLAGVTNNITDPLKTYIDAINTATANAFAQLLLGQTSTKSANFNVSATNDSGKVFSCTNALTSSLPAASSAGDGFNFVVYNNSSGAIVLDPNSSELINGAATITLDKKYSAAFVVCNGTAWYAFIINQFLLTQSTLASATTTDLGTALTNNVTISGTTTITSFGSAASTGNPLYFLTFSGALTLTYNATSMIIPGAANITTVAGDTAVVEYLGSGNWKVRDYTPISGLPIISTPPTVSFKDKVLYGLGLSNGSDATNDINIAAGSCVSDDGTTVMTLTAIVKQLDAAWAVGTNAGGLDTGSIANTTYHLWVINRPDTNVTDVLFSASASSPTMPTNYTKKKCIGSIVRASASILGFSQFGNNFYLNTPVLDHSTGATAGTSAITATLSSVPTGAKFKAFCNGVVVDNANNVYVSSLDNTDLAASASVAPLATMGSGGTNFTGQFSVWTSTSSQIRVRQSTNSAGGFKIATLGWMDTRI